MSRAKHQRITVESLINQDYCPPTATQSPIPTATVVNTNSVDELLVDALREVSKPYHPLLDYFRTDHGQLFGPASTQPNATPSPTTASVATAARSHALHSSGQPTDASPPVSTRSTNPVSAGDANLIARFPAKSKPCDSCPALSGGLCRCALKKARKAPAQAA